MHAEEGRAFGFVTQGQMVAERFGRPSVGVVMAVISLLGFIPYLALQMKGAGYVLEELTGLPIPLGGIAAKKNLGKALIRQIDAAVNNSIRLAMADPDETLPYIRRHAQEMNDTVLQAHIRTFVNDFSLAQTDLGRQAIEKLESMARDAGAI